MRKYNLTIWQRIFEVPILWVWWCLADKSKRKKTFHLVKRGIEKHDHKFTILVNIGGCAFRKCEHEGCNLHDPID